MQLRAVKGMNDVLPDEIGRWHRLERAFRRCVELHRYREVRTPVVEPTSLFVRSIGEATDIVEKEMYSFEKHGDGLTLRPEGTAGSARAYLEHNVHAREPVSRWWYLGPMFRAERPQKGRYRQFWQAGCEVFGDPGPSVDAEMIDMLVGLFRELGVQALTVHLNSLGGPGTRQRYRDTLVEHLRPREAELSDDSRRRLGTNPLRVLDSKDPRDQAACEGAPSILDVLDDEDRKHFDELRRHLDALGTPYVVDGRLVRGLDYYTRTLFEIRGQGGDLGAQNALAGGGRYDGMIAELGGPSVPAIGFAMGLERLLLAMGPAAPAEPPVVLVAPLGDAAPQALLLARELRQAGVVAEVDARGGSLKSMLRRANALAAPIALILGQGEIERGVVQLKDLAAHAQEDVPRADVARVVRERIDRLIASRSAAAETHAG
jgi:histidyl-tRNA synthetase